MAQFDARFVLDLAGYRLLAGDEPVPLERQPMELLRLLASRRGELVSREDIVKALWPDGTNVSEDQSINRAVRRLRLALGDDSETPRFIETVVGKGYRFVGPIELRQAPPPAPAPPAAAPPAAPPGSPGPPPTAPARRRPYSQLVLTTALVLFGASGWMLYAIHARDAAPLVPQPLTAYAGDEKYPSVSPGGDEVAFAWNGAERAHWEIYVTPLGKVSDPLQLTDDGATATMPAWSPDGRWIAFEQQTGSQFDLRLVSPRGGPERSIATGLAVRSPEAFSPPAWSPDSQAIVVADFDAASQSTRLVVVRLASGEVRVLVSVAGPGEFLSPALAPSGSALAYHRCSVPSVCDLYLADVDPTLTRLSSPRRLTHDGHFDGGLTWLPDGRTIVYGDLLHRALRRVAVRTGASEPVPGATGGLFPSMGAHANPLVFVQPGWDIHLWIFRHGGTAGPEGLLPSSLADVNPTIAPDGSRIVFASERGGIGRQIWVGSLDPAARVVAVTEPTGRNEGTPRWSPDGHWIAYGAQDADGHSHVHVMDESGSHPRRLTADAVDEQMPSWSHDGRFVYVGSSRTGRLEIWRVPVAHPGVPEQVTFAGGLCAIEGPDGSSVFYTKRNSSDDHPLFLKSLAGPEETTVVPAVFRSDFVPVTGGVYYVTHARPGRQDEFELRLLTLATHATTVLNRFEALDVVGLTVSPDGQTVVTSAVRPTAGSDLAWFPAFR